MSRYQKSVVPVDPSAPAANSGEGRSGVPAGESPPAPETSAGGRTVIPFPAEKTTHTLPPLFSGDLSEFLDALSEAGADDPQKLALEIIWTLMQGGEE